jgi:hypothetical protein
MRRREFITALGATARIHHFVAQSHTPRNRCVRFVRRYRRLTQHSLPGDLLGLYLGRTCTG